MCLQVILMFMLLKINHIFIIDTFIYHVKTICTEHVIGTNVHARDPMHEL